MIYKQYECKSQISVELFRSNTVRQYQMWNVKDTRLKLHDIENIKTVYVTSIHVCCWNLDQISQFSWKFYHVQVFVFHAWFTSCIRSGKLTVFVFTFLPGKMLQQNAAFLINSILLWLTAMYQHKDTF